MSSGITSNAQFILLPVYEAKQQKHLNLQEVYVLSRVLAALHLLVPEGFVRKLILAKQMPTAESC